MMDCLIGVVGVTTNTSTCNFQDATQTEIDRMQSSKSGLYVDEVEGGFTLSAVKAATDRGTLAKEMLHQIAIAEKLTYNNVRLALAKKFNQNKTKFNGTLGEFTYTNVMGIGGAYAGLKIRSASRDGMIHLKNLAIIVDAAATTDIYVIRTKRGAQAGEIVLKIENITTTPFTIINVPVPANTVLPTYHDYSDADYYILFDRNGGSINPVDNKVSCNCGNKNAQINQFATVTGVTVNSLNTLGSLATSNEYANGIVATVEMVCATTDFMCRQYDENDEIAIALASAVQYKAAELTVEAILRSPEISRFTMQNREYMWGKRNHFKAEFNNLIGHITEYTRIDGTDCFICRTDGTDITITGIIS